MGVYQYYTLFNAHPAYSGPGEKRPEPDFKFKLGPMTKGYSVELAHKYLSTRLSTIDLLVKMACFVKNKNIFSIKTSDLNDIVQGGQSY
jgi:hypothetical protein